MVPSSAEWCRIAPNGPSSAEWCRVAPNGPSSAESFRFNLYEKCIHNSVTEGKLLELTVQLGDDLADIAVITDDPVSLSV